MTKEDPLYKPCPEHTNPFAANAQLSAGKKLVATEMERQYLLELSMTLPLETQTQMMEPNNNYMSSRKQSLVRQSFSLPDSPGIVQRAIAQFNSQISSSHSNRNLTTSPLEKLFSSGYASDGSSLEDSITSHQFVRQRNLECAMLFSGLDLIQMQRASSSEWSDTNISSIDLESEFQDDLEDVLRQSQWNPEQTALSPTQDSAFGDLDTTDWYFSAEPDDPAACRYLHPTLVEKKKQLRRVESRQKEKLELLQSKLEQLKLTTKKKKGKSLNQTT